jgi:beta-N-acetylhexosaminidase
VKARLGWILAVVAGIALAAPAAAQPHHIDASATTPSAQSEAAYALLTPAERVGQLFMAGLSSTNPSPATIAALLAHHVGNVILDGNSSLGIVGTATVAGEVTTGLEVNGVRPFVSTDQEGGEVQRLSGPGFSKMPTALAQGQLSPAVLQRRAQTWGEQMASAGVTLNLAPVADTVPAAHPHANAPIGRYDRELGYTPSVVAPHVAAVVRGEELGGVDVTVKHFPGLGRASGNTDLKRHVTDPTGRRSPYLTPFQAGVDAGAPFVMVSLATYPNIDPGHPACFSSTVITDMLRGDLGFTGIVISDSFHAKAVRSVPPRTAAIEYFRAGGTILLDTQRQPIYAMEKAVLAEQASDPAFAATIKADVLSVLSAKVAAGLLAG